jgi:hypothetical protein
MVHGVSSVLKAFFPVTGPQSDVSLRWEKAEHGN